MMEILLIPQIRDEDKIWYEITEDRIAATINGLTDVFDFRGIPNGVLDLYGDDGEPLIETKIGEVPILDARKENGELFVELLFSIDIDETDSRLLFPEVMTLREFNLLMDDISKINDEEEGQEEDFSEEGS